MRVVVTMSFLPVLLFSVLLFFVFISICDVPVLLSDCYTYLYLKIIKTFTKKRNGKELKFINNFARIYQHYSYYHKAPI